MSNYNYETMVKTIEEATHKDGYYHDFNDMDRSRLHQIAELANYIRTKVKGSDVREAMAQAVERMYIDMTAEGNANFEVSYARGNSNSLGARLSEIEAKISRKADEFDTMKTLENIADGSPRGVFDDLNHLKQTIPNGEKGIFITKNNNSWNYWNGSAWTFGGVYQAQLNEFAANKVTDGKTSAYIKANMLKLSFEAMWISVKGAVIVDGSNNIWPGDYEGPLSHPNGFLVYNKATKKFDMSPIENFDRNNVILGLIWGNGDTIINSVTPYSIRKNGVWKEYNRRKIKTATVTGSSIITIENFTFSEKPKLFLDRSSIVFNVDSTEIIRVENATDGYLLYNSTDNKIYLKKIETVLDNELADMYLISILWHNGVYTENGVLKNVVDTRVNINKTAPNARIVTIGDSITRGLKNYNTPREFYDKSWANYMLDYYGGSLRNLAVSGKSIAGTDNQDFNGQVNSVNFADFDLAIIAMGVNDFNYQNSIETLKTQLRKGLDKIFKDNKNINVVGILPHNLFRLPFTSPPNTVYVDGLKFADRNGKTLNDFCNALAEVYDEYYIPYIDWRKAPVLTLRNYNKWTWDAIHPNEEGHALIGRRVAEWLKVNV